MKTAIIRIAPDPQAAKGAPAALRATLLVDDGDGTFVERASDDFAAAMQDPALPALGLLDAAKIQDLIEAVQGTSTLLAEIGAHLFKRLGKVAVAWAALRAAGDVQTVIDVQSDDWKGAAWELLCRDALSHYHLDLTHPVVRGMGSFPAPLAPAITPIRILIVVGCDAEDTAAEWEDELHRILQALRPKRHLVDVEPLLQPTKKQLIDKLKQLNPHVLHFIGHGNTVGGKPILELSHARGTDELSAADLAPLLQGLALRFVFLNACRSSSKGLHEGGWRITEAFRRIGTPAILGMQGDIPGAAAAVFAGEFYRALAARSSIDSALTQARLAIIAENAYSIDHRAWSLPTLSVSARPAEILPCLEDPPEERQRLVEGVAIKGFVDRRAERRLLARQRNLLLVVGEEKVGKTSLVNYTLEGLLLGGNAIRYVDLAGASSKSFLDVLRLIRDGTGNAPLHHGLPPEAFHGFNRDLNAILAGDDPPLGPAAGPVTDDGKPFAVPADRKIKEEPIKLIFSLFREALAKAAGAAPLTIVLDGLGGVYDDHVRDKLIPSLFSPVARGQVAPVRMILVVTDREYDKFNLRSLETGADKIPVPAFPKEEFVLLATECLRTYRCPPAQVRKMVEATVDLIEGEQWMPEKLVNLLKLFGVKTT